jgi:hypothetical protein
LERLAEQQGVAYAKTVADSMNLKLDMNNQQTARNCAAILGLARENARKTAALRFAHS